jgi:hypothetical protein
VSSDTLLTLLVNLQTQRLGRQIASEPLVKGILSALQGRSIAAFVIASRTKSSLNGFTNAYVLQLHLVTGLEAALDEVFVALGRKKY